MTYKTPSNVGPCQAIIATATAYRRFALGNPARYARSPASRC
jgi:hypothetical protein